MIFQIALIEIGQRWMLSDQSGLDVLSEEEHRGGGAVVGASAGILIDAAAELAEGHHQNALVVAVLFHVGPERADALGKLLHELVMAAALLRVGVEAAEAHVVHARGQAARDHRGHRAQSRPELSAGILLDGLVILGDAHDLVAAHLRVHGGAGEEVELT